MQRVFSGIQPTGSLHLGNYLGAIRNWVRMQAEMPCIFGIMDLHAITLPMEPGMLRTYTREAAAALVACGINPEKSLIVVQSTIPAHPELAWILGCHTPLGWLNRMTQFKEKSGKTKESAGLGLYSYPVLQAADILVYKATHVPVGEDQKQHLELSRDIAGAFNRAVGQDFFPLPEPLIQEQGARIMSLRDGTKKMSKSDASDWSRINLTDDADTIAAKFKKAKSDAIEGISYDEENRPEAANLIGIYAALSGKSIKETEAQFASSNFSTFKNELADLAVATIGPITARMRELLKDTREIDAILQRGTERALTMTTTTMNEVKELVGFW
jgi:tryptophanyl-tRNA synthetase